MLAELAAEPVTRRRRGSVLDRQMPAKRQIHRVLLVGERSGRVLSCRDTVSSSRDRPPSRKPFSWTAYPEEIIAAVKRGHPVRSALLGFQLRQQIGFTLGGEASVELGLTLRRLLIASSSQLPRADRGMISIRATERSFLS